MSRFNLLEENWIRVLEEGEMKEVSLITLFENAEKYHCLAGEMATQDFAMLRFLLAVLHTVFSRVNADGEAYEFLEIDEKFRQKEAVSEDDEEEYNDALMDTWKTLWKRGKFPAVVKQYLEAWKEHFYLLDEKYPFYQVTKEEIFSRMKGGKNPSTLSGKNLNRNISESDNKIALFSPMTVEYKSKMREGQFVRWLLMLQGYIGLSDKAIVGEEKYKSSKGWFFDIGGIFLNGETLFETLMMNLKVVVKAIGEEIPIQKPCWEHSGAENIDRSFLGIADNLSELYTNWSRAVLLDSSMDFAKDIKVDIVKLPELDHRMMEIEPMTLWKYNDSGENKNFYTPRKYRPGQSLWRSYGLITVPIGLSEENREPGIISWLSRIEKEVHNPKIRISAVGMQDDGNATSWVPINEMIDDLALHEIVLFEKGKEGWVLRIKELVEDTKEVIGIYKGFLKDLYVIRNTKKPIEEELEQAYFELDKPFRDWLSDIDTLSSKEEKIKQWKETLLLSMKERALEKVNEHRKRDIKGIYEENTKGVKNIFTAYEYFLFRLKKKLNQE